MIYQQIITNIICDNNLSKLVKDLNSNTTLKNPDFFNIIVMDWISSHSTLLKIKEQQPALDSSERADMTFNPTHKISKILSLSAGP